MTRHKALLSLVLSLTKAGDMSLPSMDINFDEKMVVWGYLFTDVVCDNAKATTSSIANARINMVKLLFAYGANPNSPWNSDTVWVWFSHHVRQSCGKSSDATLLSLDQE